MARPRKCRRVCRLPENEGFVPLSKDEDAAVVVLNVDEYETLRLIDKEGFSQEACGEFMHVGRTTVQQIYASARYKLATALVEGRRLQISGGDYRLCSGDGDGFGCERCHKRCHQLKVKGGKQMKIAIPLDENQMDVCPVLARAPYFLFWEKEQVSIVENPAASAQGGAGIQVAQFLVDQSVTVLITPRCGENAAEVFTAADLKIYKSAHAVAMDDLNAYLNGKLEMLTHFHGGYQGIR